MKCKICGDEVTSSYFLTKHRKEKHPLEFQRYSKKARVEVGSSSEMFHQGEELIRKALREVDTERNAIQQKLLELDSIAAKYKKLLNPNAL